MLFNIQENIFNFGSLLMISIALIGCNQNVSEDKMIKTSVTLKENLGQPEKPRTKLNKVATPITIPSLAKSFPKEYYTKLCENLNYPDYEGEELFRRSKPMKAFLQANGGGWFNFTPTVYDARVDYNKDGIEDFYLTAPGYNHSSYTQDYTVFYIVPGALGASESSEPDFTKKTLIRVFFVKLNRSTFQRRNPKDIPNKGNIIITARATPIEFKNEIYLKIQAQLDQSGNSVYRSAYLNSPDWTTYVKINHRMELQPIC